MYELEEYLHSAETLPGAKIDLTYEYELARLNAELKGANFGQDITNASLEQQKPKGVSADRDMLELRNWRKQQVVL
jgi:predicted HicB family RNase H-like nuclease